jgi:hypothetical protein
MAGREELRARLASPGGWGEVGSIDHYRYSMKITQPVGRLCHCGCGTRVTHAGMANGVCLTSGCELAIRRWVRGPFSMRMASMRRSR